MRQSEAFSGLETAKANFANSVAKALKAIPGLRSVTFAGSFVEKPGLSGISDIDVIVVVDVLTEANFVACKRAVSAVSPAELGFPDCRLFLNDTFGPLKFDQVGVIVVHLMIYDVAGHREHVLKSPFTCLDWERSPFHFGSSLREVFPVLGLQPRQFLEARRSLANYLEDIASASISFRRHQFDGPNRTEILESLPLDRRHQGEYAFHITRNLVANYAKLVMKSNRQLPDNEFFDFWRQHLPDCSGFISWFIRLRETKQARGLDFPTDTLDRTREFLTAFAREIEDTWTNHATRHLFVRHASTDLNDGRFLGQRRDPQIASTPPPLVDAPEQVFASPALRSRQTADALVPGTVVVIDERLNEIDYGLAEGLDYAALVASYGEIADGWARGEDPPFPGGENTADVVKRLKSFLSELPPRSSLVVTHNVVLRCFLGIGLGLPVSCWHRIPVAHLEAFEALQLNGELFLNLSPSQIAKISDEVAGRVL